MSSHLRLKSLVQAIRKKLSAMYWMISICWNTSRITVPGLPHRIFSLVLVMCRTDSMQELIHCSIISGFMMLVVLICAGFASLNFVLLLWLDTWCFLDISLLLQTGGILCFLLDEASSCTWINTDPLALMSLQQCLCFNCALIE